MNIYYKSLQLNNGMYRRATVKHRHAWCNNINNNKNNNSNINNDNDNDNDNNNNIYYTVITIANQNRLEIRR